jgi:hypothetical protein
MRGLFISILLSSFLTVTAFAHEVGAPFSGAIVEPFKVHHAHIEDEQRLNSEFLNNFRAGSEQRAAFINNLELAASWGNEFRIGSEIFIPFSNTGPRKSDYSLGDIVLQPLKYALINKPETIITGVMSLKLPTGSESKGLGAGNTGLGSEFFFDHAYRNWYFGSNFEISTNITGRTGTEFEMAGVMSYSFIKETGEGVAPSKPHQTLVPALSLEILSESVLGGAEKGENIVSILPGFHLWLPSSGWSFRFGVEVPITAEKEHDYGILFQIGNHFDWGRLFKKNG